MDLLHDLDGMGERALLCTHLHELFVFALRLNQDGSFGRVVAARLLHETCLPACNPAMAIGVCQWSGVAMVIASTSFCSSILRKSFFLSGLAHLLLRNVGELFDDLAVHIADMRDAGGVLFALRPTR